MKSMKKFCRDEAGQLGGLIPQIVIISIAILFALTLVQTVATNTEATLRNHDFLLFAVVDERVNYTGLGDSAIALAHGGGGEDLIGTPIVKNTSGVVFATTGNYTIDSTAGTITVIAAGLMFDVNSSDNNLTDITYNYTSWTTATLTNFSSAQNIANLLPFVYIIIPVLAVVAVFT